MSKKNCAGYNKKGQPCRAYPLTGGDYCLFHEDDSLTAFNAARSRGGNHKARNRDILDLRHLPFDFHDPVALLAFIEGFIRMQLAGSIPQRQCALILRSLRSAERTLAGYGAGVDPETYSQALAAFSKTAKNVAIALDERDVHERTCEISDLSAKREEYLKMNRQYGHNQPKPTPDYSPAHPKFDLENLRAQAFHNHPFLQP